MKCETFRSVVAAWEADGRIEPTPLEEALEHARTCPECRRWGRAFLVLAKRDAIAPGNRPGAEPGKGSGVRPESASRRAAPAGIAPEGVRVPPSAAAIALADAVVEGIRREGNAQAGPEHRRTRDRDENGMPPARAVRPWPARRAGRPGATRRGVAGRLLAALLLLSLGAVGGAAFTARSPRYVTVRFELDDETATSVYLAGSFTDWDSKTIALRRGDDGLWVAKVRLRRGRTYEYSFVVDGETWVVDPAAPERIDDGFGGESSLLRL